MADNSERPSSVRGTVWRAGKATIAAPTAAFPARQIRDNASLIFALVNQLRWGTRSRADFPGRSDVQIDLGASAFTFGSSDAEMAARIANRRRQSARQAYGALSMGCVFAGLWIYRGLSGGFAGPHLVAALEFTPFCLIFFLVAFKAAHVNWQLRSGRAGSAGEYLNAPETFWPS